MTVQSPDTATIKTDVLVVGGGGAGFRAAIAAREQGADALLLSKGALARSGASPMAGADFTADGQSMRAAGFFGEPRDSAEKFFSDLVHHGCFLNNQRLLDVYVRLAGDRLRELLAWGVRVDFTDERAIFTAGTRIMDALHRQARKAGVVLREDAVVLDLLVRDDRVVGAVGLDLLSGDFFTIQSRAVVLATGGWHKAYTPITGSRELTGDGVAMALRAGAVLANMEFVTFCCNVSLWPPGWRGSIFPYVLSLVVGGGLQNAAGEDFLSEYDPEMVQIAWRTEWNKCFMSLATEREVRRGKGTVHGGVYYTRGDIPWNVFEERVTRHYPGWRYKGADYSAMSSALQEEGNGVEVGAAAEYFEGGVDVNERYETSVPGLFAAGECAVSLFGANRVASAITEMLVTGFVAGSHAGEYARETAPAAPDLTAVRDVTAAAVGLLRCGTGSRPADLRAHLQTMSQDKLGPIRTASALTEALTEIDRIKREELPRLRVTSTSRRYNREWFEALDLRNIVQVLGASAQAALARTESRGVHYREDYPVTDNQRWLQEILLGLEREQLRLSCRPVTVVSLTPPKACVPYLDMIKQLMKAHSDVGGHH